MGIISNSKISTQDHLEIEDIRDDLVLLKDCLLYTSFDSR